jgi:hypothetical protein
MGWVKRSSMTVLGCVLALGATASSAQAPVQPLNVSLMRGGDDRLTDGLVDAIRAAAPTAGVTFVDLGTNGAVPLELGIPRPYGRHHFMMPVGQPDWKMPRHARFHDYRVYCDKRQQDACAGRVLALLDKRFRRRG